MPFLQCKCLSFHWYFTKVYSQGFNWQYSDNGLAPLTRQAIIWISDGLVYWCIYASCGLNWGWVTHMWVGNLTIIGTDNGLSPGWCQAIIWINSGILLIGPWVTNFSEILISIQTLSFKKMHLKMSSVKWRSFCLGLNVLKQSDNL